MYCPVSDTIAAELPKLSEAVVRLDTVLFHNRGQVLTEYQLRELATTSSRDLAILTERYSDQRILEAVKVFACPQHETEFILRTKSVRSLHCDQCDRSYEAAECTVLSAFRIQSFEPKPSSPGELPNQADGGTETVPRVFISYSHDSPEHAAQVLELADRLREYGIDAWIDQYDPHPPEGWPLWMERQIELADFVLVVCTERYFRRTRGEELPGVGKGVAWESILITAELYENPHYNAKFIPVLFSNGDAQFIPKRLRIHTRYLLGQFTLSEDQSTGFQMLYRRLTGKPVTPDAPLGQPKKIPSRERQQTHRISSDPKSDTSRELTRPTESELCREWRKRLEYFLLEEAKCSDPVKLFEIKNQIDGAKKKIAEHCPEINRQANKDGRRTNPPKESSVENSTKTNAAKRKSHVFISHSTADIKFVQKLSSDLKSRDIPVWFDRQELGVGDSLVTQFNQAIDQASYLIVVLSKSSVESSWVNVELNAAFVREMSERQTVILPVVIEDCEIPPLLRDRLWADFRKDYLTGLKAILKVLEQEREPYEDVAGLRSDSGDCITNLKSYSLARLRLLIAKLTLSQITVLWFDAFETSMQDELPKREKVEYIIELLTRAKSAGKLPGIYEALCSEYRELIAVWQQENRQN